MRTKVAIVLPYFSNGGAQVMITRFVSKLDLREVDVEVICVYGEPLGNWMEKTITDAGIPIRYIGKGKGFSGGAVIRLYKELNRFNPNIVHTHLSACVYCAPWIIAHRKIMLHTVHNIPAKELIKSKQAVMRVLYKQKAAVPVAISHEIRSLIKEYYHPAAETELIYNPVDIDKFASVSKTEHANSVAITAGRLSKQKNHKLLIDAFIMYHDHYAEDELIILGDGPCRADLEEQIKKNKAEAYIHLAGSVDTVPEYFGKVDVFVLSSEYEGLPLVVLEAMASSLPIISTDVGGVRDLVSDNGILIESGDKDQLCTALILLMHDDRKRETMGERSFELVQKFDSGIIAQEYLSLYKKYAR